MGVRDKTLIKAQKSWSNKSLRWVCALANGTGGILRVTCSDALGTPEESAQRITARIQVALGVTAEARVAADAPQCVDVEVSMSPVPVSCKGIYYAIEGKKCIALNGAALEELMLRKKRLKWESGAAVSFTMSDIDKEAFAAFRDQTARAGKLAEGVLEASKKAFLRNMHLLNGNSPTNAAMLLFASDPARWQLGAYIRLGYFDANGNLIREMQIRGPLFMQVDSVMEELRSEYLKSAKRSEYVPTEAVREALVNAVCHKQYESGVPIQIRAYPTRLLIANRADLPADWSEKTARHMQASNPLNPTLANALYAAGLVPGWGTGLQTIRDACKEEGRAHVVYRAQYGEVSVRIGTPAQVIRRGGKDTQDEQPAPRRNMSADTADIVDTAGTADTIVADHTKRRREAAGAPKAKVEVKPVQVPADAGRRAPSGREEPTSHRRGRPRNTKVDGAILDLLKEDPQMSTARISDAIGVPRGTISNHLARLKQEGKIAHVGSRKDGYWRVLS